MAAKKNTGGVCLQVRVYTELNFIVDVFLKSLNLKLFNTLE
uniref:Uncharacterized protein n=1 Tax=Anguilla anguilla TaxID=7936 RepID=A0A0E9UJ12_ANGAN